MNICMSAGYSIIFTSCINYKPRKDIQISKFESYKLPCVLCIAITTASTLPFEMSSLLGIWHNLTKIEQVQHKQEMGGMLHTIMNIVTRVLITSTFNHLLFSLSFYLAINNTKNMNNNSCLRGISRRWVHNWRGPHWGNQSNEGELEPRPQFC